MKKLFKTLFMLGLLFILAGLIVEKKEVLSELIDYLIKNKDNKITAPEKNAYYRNYDFSYVQNTSNFIPECRQDLLNIYYTIINSGVSEYDFFCHKDYDDCIANVKEIANDQEILSTINNYVHPYNGFQHIETKFDNYGKITITIQKSYSGQDIKEVNAQLDYIENNIVDKSKSTEDNIRAIHDYIINTTKYDKSHDDNNKSETAFGALINGYSICGGYTDAMELMLERLNIESYKVSSSTHIWNAVNLNDKWYHIDLTWDDPVTENGTDILDDSFFLIDTKKLLEIEPKEHNFNEDSYAELKNA